MTAIEQELTQAQVRITELLSSNVKTQNSCFFKCLDVVTDGAGFCSVVCMCSWSTGTLSGFCSSDWRKCART